MDRLALTGVLLDEFIHTWSVHHLEVHYLQVDIHGRWKEFEVILFHFMVWKVKPKFYISTRKTKRNGICNSSCG